MVLNKIILNKINQFKMIKKANPWNNPFCSKSNKYHSRRTNNINLIFNQIKFNHNFNIFLTKKLHFRMINSNNNNKIKINMNPYYKNITNYNNNKQGNKTKINNSLKLKSHNNNLMNTKTNISNGSQLILSSFKVLRWNCKIIIP